MGKTPEQRNSDKAAKTSIKATIDVITGSQRTNNNYKGWNGNETSKKNNYSK